LFLVIVLACVAAEFAVYSMSETRGATLAEATAPTSGLAQEDEVYRRCKGIVFAFAAGAVLSIRMVGDLALV